MVKIYLKNNHGFSWYSSDTISIKGSFFDDNNNYYEKDNALLFFKNVVSEKDFINKLNSINGIFTILIKVDNKLFIACDITRIFPLFYTKQNNNIFISDTIEHLKENLNISTIDERASEEFLASGYTLGNKTLLKNIHQIQSSEYICFDKNQITNQGFYFSYATNSVNNKPYKVLKEQAIIAFENSFKRLIKSLNNRQVVLPLSSGFDSRLIAVMLKKNNYKNVICFTYGKGGNFEIENSKKTAEALGFKWFFIEYTSELIESYIETDIFKKYTHYISKDSTMIFLQEYFAVKYLKEKKIVSTNAIFIPGHSGDLLGGSQFEKVIPNNLNSTKLSTSILKHKYNYSKIELNKKKQLLKRIDEQLIIFDKNYFTKTSHSVFEDFDIKEKIAKIIFNSSGVYTFFDYEHRFPFWDKELLFFFKNIPIEYKKRKLLYDDILKNHYFESYKVNFKKNIISSKKNIISSKIKNKVKPYFPFILKEHFLIKNDWLNAKTMTDEMEKSMKINNLPYNSKIKAFNEINIQWYIYFCKGLIKK